jgi:hypothetical protein
MLRVDVDEVDIRSSGSDLDTGWGRSCEEAPNKWRARQDSNPRHQAPKAYACLLRPILARQRARGYSMSPSDLSVNMSIYL